MDYDYHLGCKEEWLDIPPEQDLVGGDFFSDATRTVTLELKTILKNNSLLARRFLLLENF
jgi:hypothetical protein